jgi:cytochrome c oxidase subunit 1
VLIGGLAFTIFAAIYYWYHKAMGRMLNKKLGLWHFWLFTIGFHLTFDTMHFQGLLGMPRRIFTYDAGRGWETLNLITSVGALLQAVEVLCLLINVVRSWKRGEKAGNDPCAKADHEQEAANNLRGGDKVCCRSREWKSKLSKASNALIGVDEF